MTNLFWTDRKKELDIQWERFYKRVEIFSLNNDRLPKKNSRNREEQILSAWIQKQKAMYFGDGMCQIKEERRNRLEKLPYWNNE